MASAGSSREAHLRRLLAGASGLDRSSMLAVADGIAASTVGRTHADATELIGADRDRDGQ